MAVSGCRTMTVRACPAETPSRSRRKWGDPSRVSTCRCFWWHSAPATAASIACAAAPHPLLPAAATSPGYATITKGTST